MRKKRAVLGVGILFLIGLFITEAALAAPPMSKWTGQYNMAKWVGKWFSYKGKMKAGRNQAGYFKIWKWDGVDFYIDTYYLDNNVWQPASATLLLLAGNDMNFFFLFQNEEEGVEFVALLRGKEKNGILKSAKAKSYGGIVVADDVAVGSTVIAKMVDESKVKVPPSVWLH